MKLFFGIKTIFKTLINKINFENKTINLLPKYQISAVYFFSLALLSFFHTIITSIEFTINFLNLWLRTQIVLQKTISLKLNYFSKQQVMWRILRESQQPESSLAPSKWAHYTWYSNFEESTSNFIQIELFNLASDRKSWLKAHYQEHFHFYIFFLFNCLQIFTFLNNNQK